MTISIERMKTLCDEATDGPWIRVTHDDRKNISISMVKEVVTEFDKRKPLVTLSATAWKPERWGNAGPNADFIAASRTFVPEAIRVMEQMAEASRNAREPLLLKYVEPQWDGDYGEVYCGEWCKYCKQHVGDDEGKGQSLIDREYGHKPECPISKNLSALAAYNALANPQEIVKGDE